MIKAIVYTSSTGHTERYAKMLSEKLEIPYYTINEAKATVSKKDEIIYMGWVCASKISGLNKARKRYSVKICSAVGLFPTDDNNIKNLKEANKINSDFFYLQGGVDYTKLKGIKKKILQMVGKAIEDKNKEASSDIAKIFKDGADFVSEKNLQPLIQSISKYNNE